MRHLHPTLFLALVLFLAVASVAVDWALAGPTAQRRAGDLRRLVADQVEDFVVQAAPEGGPCGDWTPGRGLIFGPRTRRQAVTVWDCSAHLVVEVEEYGPPARAIDPRGPRLAAVTLEMSSPAAALVADLLRGQ